MIGKWEIQSEGVTIFQPKNETISPIKFQGFCLGIYSTDFEVAAAICGKASDRKIWLIGTWEPRQDSLGSWVKSWTKTLGTVSPVRANKGGLAAQALVSKCGYPNTSQAPDIAPIEMQLELPEINGQLCEGWSRIREVCRHGIGNRETAAIGGAVLIGARLAKKFGGRSGFSVISKPRSSARIRLDQRRKRRF